jgi:hypothetical protein
VAEPPLLRLGTMAHNGAHTYVFSAEAFIYWSEIGRLGDTVEVSLVSDSSHGIVETTQKINAL